MSNRKNKSNIQVYTDGGFDWDRKVGGYGAVIFMKVGESNRMRKLSSTVSYVDTTSNRMEIRAILACLNRIKPGHNIDIYTDSQYCVKMFNNIQKSTYRITWAKNSDLWKKVRVIWLKHLQKGSYMNVNWIRGHSGNTFNEMADSLAFVGSNRAKKVVCDQNMGEDSKTYTPATHRM